MILVKIEKHLPNVDSALFRRCSQGFDISDGEPGIRVLGVGRGLLQLRNAPGVLEHVAFVLGIDRFELPVCR